MLNRPAIQAENTCKKDVNDVDKWRGGAGKVLSAMKTRGSMVESVNKEGNIIRLLLLY